MNDSFSGIFADDTLIAKEITNHEDVKQLQNDLDGVERWASTWVMQFNTVKCNIITVTNKTNKLGSG